MKRFLSIWFPQLETELRERRDPTLRDFPFVLTQKHQNRLIVKSSNAAACRAGIFPGITLADARALVSGIKFEEENPKLREKMLKRMAAYCIRFTPSVSLDDPDGLVLDASGCAHLWGGEQSYIQFIRMKFLEKGFTSRPALASTIGAAWGFARYGKENFISDPQKETLQFLSLPPAALQLTGEQLQLLSRLGLTRIADFAGLPRNVLRNRFGPLLLDRLDQTLGKKQEWIQPIICVEPFEERLPALEPIRTRAGIELALENLLETLLDKLKKEEKGARQLLFRIYRLDGTEQEIAVSTIHPSVNKAHLLKMFEPKLGVLEPREGIELFLLCVKKAEPLRVGQSSFFSERGGSAEKLAELLDHLAQKIGEENIISYRPVETHCPYRALERKGVFEEGGEWFPRGRRPILLLSPPERIEVTAPVPDYPPMLFRHNGKLHRVKRAEGPERMEEEWWFSNGEEREKTAATGRFFTLDQRDFFTLENEVGERFWVFRQGPYSEHLKDQWYLCGYFA